MDDEKDILEDLVDFFSQSKNYILMRNINFGKSSFANVNYFLVR